MMIKLLHKILGMEHYVSELDQYLVAFDRAHPKKSATQQKEINKYARIYELRDVSSPNKKKTTSPLWDEF